jgi:hypothetical protein
MADISARRMFCSPINLCDMFILSSGFHMLYPALAGFGDFLGGCE